MRRGPSILVTFLATVCKPEDPLPEGHFPCGLHGGSCEAGVEVCVVVDGCSTCRPAPEPCVTDPECTCLGQDPDTDALTQSCYEQGECELIDGGLSVSCTESDPPLGCG